MERSDHGSLVQSTHCRLDRIGSNQEFWNFSRGSRQSNWRTPRPARQKPLPPPCLITACLLHWRLWGLGTRQINGVNLKSADQVAQKDGRMMDFNRHRKSPNWQV